MRVMRTRPLIGESSGSRGGLNAFCEMKNRASIVARYILENPVRAGLARTVSEYPFVGSQLCELKDVAREFADLKVGTT